jgi:hypothetical protein
VRIECVECRALVEPTWSLTGGELVARCPACNGESRAMLPAHDDAAATTDASSTGPECPKCGLRPVTGDACARCGLRVDKMASWAATATVPDDLAAAWEACIAAWADATTHDRAASLALSLGEQPWLARQYRAVLRDRPGDAVAIARLERANKIAQAAVLATASTPREGGYRRGSSIGILLVLVLLVIGGLLWGFQLARKRQSSDGSSVNPTQTAPRRPMPKAHTPSGGTPARTPGAR